MSGRLQRIKIFPPAVNPAPLRALNVAPATFTQYTTRKLILIGRDMQREHHPRRTDRGCGSCTRAGFAATRRFLRPAIHNAPASAPR